MKIFYSSIIILFIISPRCLSQIKSSQIINRYDGIDLHLSFTSEPYTIKKEEEKDVIEFAKAINEGNPGEPVLPSKTIFAAIPPYSKINPILINKKEFSVSNVNIKLNPEIELFRLKSGSGVNEDIIKYKNARPEPKYFVNDLYPNQDVEVVGYTWLRDFYCAAIQINTHRYNWKKKELTELNEADLKLNFSDVKPFQRNTEVKSEFDKSLSKIILNYESADEYRSFQTFASDTTGDWIDYDNEYIKLAVSEEGIYKISYDNLQSFGVNPSSINPLTFKIFFEGKQIPIFVSGEDDLSFDQNDYIEFWGEKNYGSVDYKEIVPFGINYKNYYDRYNDTNFVWLTWGDENGLRTDSIDTFIPGLTDTIYTHLVKLHLEKDVRLWYYDAVVPRVQFPDWQENKVWTWYFLGNSGSISFNFDSPDFTPNSVVKTTARLISNAADIISNAHSNGAGLNSSIPADTIIYNFRQTVNLSSQFSSNILNQTGNEYKIYGLPTSAGFHQSLIDWVDIDFFRSNNAIDDSLMITIPESVSAAERVLAASNISNMDNIFLYKVKPYLKRITAFNFSSGILTFTDTVSGGDKYLIIKDDQKKTSRFVGKKQFVNLRNNSRIADYIIITNKELEESVNQYKNFIETNYSLNVEVAYINDIYDEFSFGLDNVETVRDFLFAANQYWQSPKPSYLNLIGDANYDYKKIIVPPTNIIRKNLVPSFGNPVSDSWYVMWDSSNTNVPQMFVGRIPARNNEEVLFYLQKHQTYVNRQFDSWNKNYLFFSGGDINNPGELSQIKNANDHLLNELVRPKPVGGSGIHFYKTIDPPTNFGPYSLSEVNDAIDYGGLFISYIGHSGTQTWDNGITSMEDLKNSYSDRNPLVTDFGCSTGKFAEPDIDAFGELFLLENPNGQAINYLGNSSWGYLSTSLRFPNLFYSNLLIDAVSSIGEAHLLAKMEQFNQSGFTDVNRVFNFCNLLFGDPIISFRTPLKPNFSIKENSFSLAGNNPNDMTDSVTLNIEILNTGRVPDDSLAISVISRWFDEITYHSELKIPVPFFKDSLIVTIPINRRVGPHQVEVNLDVQNSIDEIYETDNFAVYTFTVFSTSVRPIEIEEFYNTTRSSVKVLNPTLVLSSTSDEIKVSISDNPNFTNAFDIIKNMDSVYTTINLNSLVNNKRYWWRVKLNEDIQEWSQTYSFKNISPGYEWFVDESFNANDIEYFNSTFDSLSNAWKLTSNENLLEISSAGSDDGEFASMLYNGEELLPNTFYWGIATAEIDSVSVKPSNFRYFIFANGNANELMKAYLDSLPTGKIVAMTICADGAQSVLGFGGGTEIRQTIQQFGSLYIDSVGYRDSWCLIGKKGAVTGSVPESFKRRFFGFAETSASNEVNNDTGFIVFPAAIRSNKWISLEKNDLLPKGSSIEYFPLGINPNGDVDTLNSLIFEDNISSLNNIDASVYPSLKILAKLNANNLFESPSITSLGINYKIPTELAINYQAVNVSSDSLVIGEVVKLDFGIYNASETPANSFKILVEVLKSNNEREVISNIIVDKLDSLSKKFFEVLLNTSDYFGNSNFIITIDYENKITEIFEDNNFFQIPFYVRADTSTPKVNITFDGVEILDGDYTSADPEINIELFDESFFPVNDTSSISLFLNDEGIYFSNNPQISYQFNSFNPKMTVTYKPQLSNGEYLLRVFAKNAAGNVVDSSGIEKYFVVHKETEILNVYNYPNPSSGETYFTFKLTQIPDELKIKIYTVAGRLIKEIKKNSSELKNDFNTILWDGKDDDKNQTANGVYLYKVIISKDGRNQDVTQKLAIVR
jgi:hypothetical protein